MTYKILVVASRMPSHLTTGDRLRTYFLVKGLAERAHKIDLLAFDNLNSAQYETDIVSICQTIRSVHYHDLEFTSPSRLTQMKEMIVGAWHGFPRRVWQFHSVEMVEAFKEMVSQKNYDIIHFSELGIAELLTYVADKPGPALIFDLIDAVSLSVHTSLSRRRDIINFVRFVEARQLLKFEQNLLKQVDMATVVSAKDKEFLTEGAKLQVLPNGVTIPEELSKVDKTIDLLFVGNMSTQTNIDAVKWFITQVWPQITCSNILFYVVGRDPHPSVLQFAGDKIVITGGVKDVSEYLQKCKVFVAPIRFGAGQKNKVLEAFAHKVPVVGTIAANEGIDAIDGESIIVRNDPKTMAQAIDELLNNPDKRRAIGHKAYQFVQQNFTWEHSIQILEALYRHVIENKAEKPSR